MRKQAVHSPFAILFLFCRQINEGVPAFALAGGYQGLLQLPVNVTLPKFPDLVRYA